MNDTHHPLVRQALQAKRNVENLDTSMQRAKGQLEIAELNLRVATEDLQAARDELCALMEVMTLDQVCDLVAAELAGTCAQIQSLGQSSVLSRTITAGLISAGSLSAMSRGDANPLELHPPDSVMHKLSVVWTTDTSFDS
ncbi:hypothetical protein [uncultured Xylophilus sp.]|uniref:hypothetical protein n=1 Tax=uncultured Xylophilus sp. TaxID=296832 RepID=UPI0025E67696|nr:hypothetical protein [uncultured Xylophilus sp.]